jgi:hypothetical protein
MKKRLGATLGLILLTAILVREENKYPPAEPGVY